MKKRKILIPIVSALILLIAGGIYLNIFSPMKIFVTWDSHPCELCRMDFLL